MSDNSFVWSLSDDTYFSVTNGVVRGTSGLDYEVNPTYTLYVYATNSYRQETHVITITVNDVNEPLVINTSGSTSFRLDEVVADNADLSLETYQATDPEGETITWSLSGADAGDFSISQSGELSFASAPNYESPADSGRNNVYNVTVRAAAGGHTATLNVTVTVDDVEEAPVISGPDEVTFDENSTAAVATYAISDPEGTQVNISISDTDNFTFTNNVLRFKSPPDYESSSSWNVSIFAVDDAGDGLSTILDLTITINDVNEPLQIGDGLATSIEVEEGDADYALREFYWAFDPDNDEISWSLGGDDGGDFEISDSGELTFESDPDYESPADADKNNVYKVTVQANANGHTASLPVTVTVTNVEEPPVISGPDTVDFAENGTGAVGQYSASDPEGEDATLGLASGTEGFTLVDGTLKFSSPPDYETHNYYSVTLESSDGTYDTYKDVEIYVDDVNEPPVITGVAAHTSPEGVDGPFTYTATDPEGDTLSDFSLSGNDSDLFDISSGGQLTFKTDPDFESPSDSDTDNVYEVTLSTSDGSFTASFAATITITNVDEFPTITAGGSSHDYAENGTGAVATYTATDPDGDAVAWSVEGTDASAFSIGGSSGVLAFKSSPNHETKSSYLFQVKATAGGKSATLAVAVTITDVDEAPTITAGGASHDYAENGTGAVATYTATDPEGDAITWTVEGTDAADFSISSGGVLTFDSSPDYESPGDTGENNVYDVTVKATAGGKSATLAVTITITNVAESLTITGGPTAIDYAENGTGAVGTYTATDADGGTIAWTVEGTDASAFSIGSSSGVLTFDSSPNYETKSSYSVTVKATVSGYNATLAVTVTITDVDEGPTITGGGATHDYAENGTGAVATYTATDPEDDAIAWTVEGTDAADFSISSGGVLTFDSSPDYESPGDTGENNVYDVTVKATAGGKSATQAVTVTVTNVDEAPTITAGGATHDYAENGTGAVATYTATDPEGDAITWSVEGTDAASFSIGSSTGVLAFDSSPDYEAKSSYSVTVKATANGKSATQVVTITVTNVDEGPTITAGGASHNYAENGTGAVSTYTATDPENDSVTWTVEGTDAADFSIGSTTGVLTFDSSPDYESPGDTGENNVYDVTVKATAGGKSATLAVTVTVTNVDEAPTITAGGAAHDYAENGTGAVATYTATDPENDAITWTVEGTDAADFSISSGGVLTFDSSPDYESPGDTGENNVYDVTVKATAGGKSATLAVAVTITNVAESLTITGGPTAIDYAENGTGAVGTYTATDADGGTIAWTVEGTDASAFSIGSSSGVLTFDSSPNYESPGDTGENNVYDVTVKATAGGKSATLAVAVTITNVAESLTITGGPTAIDYAENGTGAVGTYTATDADGGTIAWTVEGTDASAFSIGSSSGVLTFDSSPNYETKSSYSITVKATAGGKSATLAVTVTVTNVDEAPTITAGGATHDYAENGTGAVATYTATDPENDAIAWTVEGTDASAFSIGSSSGVLTFDSSPNYESPGDTGENNVYDVTVKATAGGKSATLAVAVTITNVAESLTITGGPTAIDYAENGTGAVGTYTATDADGGTIAWTVEGTDASAFSIGSSSGVLTFDSSPNYETKSSYSITVKATAGGKSATQAVTVTVTNVDEAPTITAGGATHDYAENGTGAVATYTATDPENDAITWTVEGTDAADFSISSGGVLTFDSSPDYESPGDTGENNVYDVTVKATAGGKSATLAVAVAVTDEEEDETPSTPTPGSDEPGQPLNLRVVLHVPLFGHPTGDASDPIILRLDWDAPATGGPVSSYQITRPHFGYR